MHPITSWAEVLNDYSLQHTKYPNVKVVQGICILCSRTRSIGNTPADIRMTSQDTASKTFDRLVSTVSPSSGLSIYEVVISSHEVWHVSVLSLILTVLKKLVKEDGISIYEENGSY